MNEDYIYQLYKEMEKDLKASLLRNLKNHYKEEEKMGFKFPQWQALKIRDIKKVAKENEAIIKRHLRNRDSRIQSILRNEYTQGKKVGYEEYIEKYGKQAKKVEDSFFNTESSKIKNLIDEIETVQRASEYAIYRKANDIYRKTIFRSSFYLEHGAKNLNQAVTMAINELTSKGINIIQYKDGKLVDVATYSRMAVRTASQRAMLVGKGELRQEIGHALVKISKHGGACPLCVPWEGRVLIDDVYSGGSRRDGRYPLLSQAMKQGLFHPNCRHGLPTYYPELEEVREELENEDKDKEDRIKKHAAKRIKTLTQKEVSAIREYTGDNFSDINRYLNSPLNIKKQMEKQEVWIKEHINTIEQVLKKSTLGEDTVIFRDDDESNFKHLKKGNVYTNKGFWSTTIDKNAKMNIGTISIEIKANSKTKGLYIESISMNPNEKEFLIQKDTKFKVLNINKKRDKILLEVIE